MALKFRRVTLPDGTTKLEKIPDSPEEIEKRRNLHNKNSKLQKEYRKNNRERIKLMSPEQRYLDKLEKRFWEKVDKKGENECWLWKGSKDKDGYGLIRLYQIYFKAHRIAYELKYGKILENNLILHRCDNPSCVNYNHLYEGTNKDNSNDRKIRNRGNKPIGELNPMSKLTRKEINQIREEYFKEGITQKELAMKYGVSRSEIGHIINNRAWKT